MTESWIQVMTIVGANFALILAMFMWIRSEGNADRREAHQENKELAKKLAEEKADTTHLIFNLTNTIIAESKDFHGRLCQIEERNTRK